MSQGSNCLFFCSVTGLRISCTTRQKSPNLRLLISSARGVGGTVVGTCLDHVIVPGILKALVPGAECRSRQCGVWTAWHLFDWLLWFLVDVFFAKHPILYWCGLLISGPILYLKIIRELLHAKIRIDRTSSNHFMGIHAWLTRLHTRGPRIYLWTVFTCIWPFDASTWRLWESAHA